MKKPRRKRSRQEARNLTKFRKSLGLALRKLRLKSKNTQAQAAEAAGLSGSSAVANIERGANFPTLHALHLFSKFYKFSIDALFSAIKP